MFFKSGFKRANITPHVKMSKESLTDENGKRKRTRNYY